MLSALTARVVLSALTALVVVLFFIIACGAFMLSVAVIVVERLEGLWQRWWKK